MILFNIALNTLKLCLCVLYSIEFGAQCLYFTYKSSLNLIERDIPYDIQLVFLWRCLLSFTYFLAYVYLLMISYDDAVCYNSRLDQLVSRNLVC